MMSFRLFSKRRTVFVSAVVAIIAITTVTATIAMQVAQFQPERMQRNHWERRHDPRRGVPDWDENEKFKHDVFTFARVKYTSWSDNYRRGKWDTDYPDSDLNFSFRLQELTSMKVHPDGVIVQLTDVEVLDYPFLYLIEPGHMMLTEAEVLGMRKYLNNGGFIMVDDFWGNDEWFTFYQQLKRVFPDKEPQELPLEHEIFHMVYDLKQKPLIPSIGHYMNGYRTERADAQEPHYQGVFDDDGRLMMMICHNTDLGDGWEQEGVDPGYFKEYSEKWAYPLGINIVTYAMTH